MVKEIKDLLKCPKCKLPFIEVKDSMVGKKTGHIFKPTCEHYNSNIRISVG